MGQQVCEAFPSLLSYESPVSRPCHHFYIAVSMCIAAGSPSLVCKLLGAGTSVSLVMFLASSLWRSNWHVADIQ